MSCISDNLRTILNELNTSQTDFAKRIGTSVVYINMLVNGKRPSISLTLAKLIEEAFGYSAEWILNNTGEKMKNMFREFIKENPRFLEDINKLTPEERIKVIDFLNMLNAEKERQRSERTPKYKKR